VRTLTSPPDIQAWLDATRVSPTPAVPFEAQPA